MLEEEAMDLVLHITNYNTTRVSTTAEYYDTLKVLIAAEYTGVKLELSEVVSNKTLEFLEKSPLGKVPVLETPHGLILQPNAIARYVTSLNEKNALYGSSKFENSCIDQWIDFSTLEIHANVSQLYALRNDQSMLEQLRKSTSIVVYYEEEFRVLACLKRALGALDTHLATNTFLVGHCITLADLVMACDLLFCFERVMTKFLTCCTNTWSCQRKGRERKQANEEALDELEVIEDQELFGEVLQMMILIVEFSCRCSMHVKVVSYNNDNVLTFGPAWHAMKIGILLITTAVNINLTENIRRSEFSRHTKCKPTCSVSAIICVS
ncbi:Glutathione S-transferase [Macleaya cordata]|uniref:Glutathione S-transferase n=1 Tax=Macleaya cordata TaxID=56857 RepID=A0A200QRQ2_MACCD|nr:Glutathione S-transferase [Macleaya cordata]